MFELKTEKEREGFRKLLPYISPYKIWQTMNDVRTMYLIPGLNMVTIYQFAEYFEIPIRQIKSIENKHRGLRDMFSRRYLQSDEFEWLAWNKRRIVFEGVQHWRYDFKDFSIHMAAAGALCYSPYLIMCFLPYIKGSKVCSDIITKLLQNINLDYYSYSIPELKQIKQSLSDYEAEENKAKDESTRSTTEVPTKTIVEKALLNLSLDDRFATVEIKVNI